MSKKLLLPIIIVVVIALIGLGAFFVIKAKSKKADTGAKKKPPISAPVNVIDLKDRPYVYLIPRADGKELTLTLHNLPKTATEMEYELEYQAGTLLQGAFGSMDLASASFPASTKILLGSCSAGGACSFHEGVTGGSLILKFRADEAYALKNEWRYIATKEAKGEFSSKDAKFLLTAGKTLDKNLYVLVMQTSGLPQGAPADVLSGPYGLYPSGSFPDKASGELSMRLSEDTTTATIYGWDGAKWVKFDTKVADKTATAKVDLMNLFIATK